MGMSDYSTWDVEVKKIKICKQRQDSLCDQLKDLSDVANKLGFYDAADYMKNICNK